MSTTSSHKVSQTLRRVRFVEQIHEDGVMAIEVVVNGSSDAQAVFRATRHAEATGQSLTDVEWVRDEVS